MLYSLAGKFFGYTRYRRGEKEIKTAHFRPFHSICAQNIPSRLFFLPAAPNRTYMYVVCVFLQFQGEATGQANLLLAESSKPTAKYLERMWEDDDALYTSNVQPGRVLYV